eukprot:TRINITY_DN20265_c0_g1::TRINITY_DN20265_c0_g1_i1::g.19669::m.19669 TRINITY_DN20265_c0_g1::TRINITY_DN20265_c0_g1_i1::g.19669  ORF type:complete len:110 (+),score=7.23 TRINITY_DN20265_c0_g1_i1:148-477(+)
METEEEFLVQMNPLHQYSWTDMIEDQNLASIFQEIDLLNETPAAGHSSESESSADDSSSESDISSEYEPEISSESKEGPFTTNDTIDVESHRNALTDLLQKSCCHRNCN